MSMTEKLPESFGILCFNIDDSREIGAFIDTYYPRNHSMAWNNTSKSIYGIINGYVDCWSAGTHEEVPLYTLEQIRKRIEDTPTSTVEEVVNNYLIY